MNYEGEDLKTEDDGIMTEIMKPLYDQAIKSFAMLVGGLFLLYTFVNYMSTPVNRRSSDRKK